MPFCENCGNKVSETAKFCPNCGASLNKGDDFEKEYQPSEEHLNRNIEDNVIKREKLIKLLLKKYINEYLYLLIISLLISVASYGYYLITLSESATGLTVLGGLFAVVSFSVLLFRLNKRNNLTNALSSNLGANSEIWAEIQTDKIYRPGVWGNESNTFVLHTLGKSFKVPEVMLPYPMEECLNIINLKLS